MKTNTIWVIKFLTILPASRFPPASRMGQDRPQPLIRLERTPMGDAQGFQYAQHGHVLGAGWVFIDVTGQALEIGKAQR